MLSHRHHIRAYLQIALASLAFISCVGDKFADDMTDVELAALEGAPLYLAVQFHFDSNTPSTRDSYKDGDKDYEYGSGDEHAIGPTGNKIIFFDEGGKLYGIYTLTGKKTDDEYEDEFFTQEDGDSELEENEEAAFRRVRFVARKGQLPESCLVILNGKEDIIAKLDEYQANIQKALADKTPLPGVSVHDLLREFWDGANDPYQIGKVAGKDGDFFFTMTSAMQGSSGPASIKNNIRKTIPEAKEAAAKLYVERMVAKFSFEINNENAEGGTDKNIFYPSQYADLINVTSSKNLNEGTEEGRIARKWRVKVTGWNVNALETESHYFKNISANGGYFEGWNDNNNFRSYWSEDPHYDKEYNENRTGKTENLLYYPWQFRRAFDYNLNYYDDFDKTGKNLLRNYSFTDLKLGTNVFDKVVYVPENTYDAQAVLKTATYPGLDQRDELLACTHLLVGAELQIMKDDEVDDDDDFFEADEDDSGYRTPKDLFRDRNGFYYLSERECVAALVHDFNQLLKAEKRLCFTHYKDWDADLSGTEELVADTEGDYSLYYKNGNNWVELTESEVLNEGSFNDTELKMPIATIRKGDGKRMPWMEKLIEENRLAIGTSGGTATPSLKIYQPKPDNHETVVADKTKLAKTTGNDDDSYSYIKSLLYEWLGAIDHFKEGKMYYAQGIYNTLSSDDKPQDWGVVRNSWYKFNLNKISSIGIPVDDVEQPIVPERVDLNDEINVTIKIIDWHKISANISQM